MHSYCAFDFQKAVKQATLLLSVKYKVMERDEPNEQIQFINNAQKNWFVYQYMPIYNTF